MKGGSYASDAVVDAVDAAAFAKMNKTFQNAFEQNGGKSNKRCAQKGGSIASSDVVNNVKPGSFEAMSANFTNQVSQKGGHRSIRCPSCGKTMKGGNIPTFESIMSNANKIVSGTKSESFIQPLQFRSEPAHVPSINAAKALGPAPGPAGLKGGFNNKLKNINEYMNKGKGQYQVFNRHIGGSDQGLSVKIGLNTTDSILSSNRTHGVAPMRVSNDTTLNIIANEEINAPEPMFKDAVFGDVTGVTQKDTNFNYGGKGGAKTAAKCKKASKAKSAPKKRPASAVPKKM